MATQKRLAGSRQGKWRQVRDVLMVKTSGFRRVWIRAWEKDDSRLWNLINRKKGVAISLSSTAHGHLTATSTWVSQSQTKLEVQNPWREAELNKVHIFSSHSQWMSPSPAPTKKHTYCLSCHLLFNSSLVCTWFFLSIFVVLMFLMSRPPKSRDHPYCSIYVHLQLQLISNALIILNFSSILLTEANQGLWQKPRSHRYDEPYQPACSGDSLLLPFKVGTTSRPPSRAATAGFEDPDFSPHTCKASVLITKSSTVLVQEQIVFQHGTLRREPS